VCYVIVYVVRSVFFISYIHNLGLLYLVVFVLFVCIGGSYVIHVVMFVLSDFCLSWFLSFVISFVISLVRYSCSYLFLSTVLY